MNWYDKSAFYHIYPLGFCGAPKENDFTSEPQYRILKVLDVIPHIKECNFNAVYFGPIFESSRHGYDTADYLTPDRRLGTDEDFKKVFDALHENGIRVIIDGVFNHVGREFWAFKDVRQNGFGSRYKDWFHVRDGGSPFGDPFFYEGWEGHYELVKLNLYNPEVKNYIKDCITKWREKYGIDGLRLDVAYCLEENFLKELHGHCKWLSEDFWLMGETLHGDYNRWANPQMLDSVTNYECYKGLFSSFNDLNMFEIAHSLNRQFGSENWCLYRGKNLYSFVDNHDVSRIVTMLKTKEHLPLIYSLLFTMPGIPSVYYGSEYGWEGDKNHGDDALRPEFQLQSDTDLTKHIAALAKLRTNSDVLALGSYNQLQLTNRQYAFARTLDGKRVITVINADSSDFTFNLNIGGTFINIFIDEQTDLSQPLTLKPYTSYIFEEK